MIPYWYLAHYRSVLEVKEIMDNDSPWEHSAIEYNEKCFWLWQISTSIDVVQRQIKDDCSIFVWVVLKAKKWCNKWTRMNPDRCSLSSPFPQYMLVLDWWFLNPHTKRNYVFDLGVWPDLAGVIITDDRVACFKCCPRVRAGQFSLLVLPHCNICLAVSLTRSLEREL